MTAISAATALRSTEAYRACRDYRAIVEEAISMSWSVERVTTEVDRLVREGDIGGRGPGTGGRFLAYLDLIAAVRAGDDPYLPG